MKGLTKVGLALLVVFVAFLMAFAAELICVLCRRRRPRRGPSVQHEPELAAPRAAGNSRGSPTPKQLLLYFLCWKKNQFRVEPASADVMPVYSLAATTSGPHIPGAKPSPFPFPPPTTAETVDVELELARWRGLYASRVLFTIREEEREGIDSDGGKSPRGGRRPVAVRFSVLGEERRDEQEEVEVGMAVTVSELTPFSTPCASPPFYTPLPSPTRAEETGADIENPTGIGGSETDNDEFFLAVAEAPPRLRVLSLGLGEEGVTRHAGD